MKAKVLTEESVVEICDVKYHHHPNGGGLVAETAEVDNTAFVGIHAMVCGRAKVKEQAKNLSEARLHLTV